MILDKYYPKNLERKWQKFWEKEKIYKFNPKKRGKIFSIDTPPPTVSGKMHIGHAFSYTHLDLIARYHRMKGENIFCPFGTDDNGLPTEKLVEKENQVSIFKMERSAFVALCQKTIKRLRPDFIQGWKDIGLSADFSLDYSTISKNVQKISQEFFIKLYLDKRAYRKESPTLWCAQCQTAIAQADMEDKELESVFNDIVFKLTDGGEIIIATTRPELLSSCVAIFVHPTDKKYQSLVGREAVVPIFGQTVKIMTDEKVDPEKGTGIVMCCTFGDINDIEWYMAYNLPLKISINRNGTMNENAKSYNGLKIRDARLKIIEDLKASGVVRSQKTIRHAVNVHERCGKEVEIIDTTQWFIKYLDIKNDFIKMGKEMTWLPDFMIKRYENWILGLKWDWCISRQRYFGIPFPVWYCRDCGEVKIAKISELPVDPLSRAPKTKCRCGSRSFIPEKDVLDTWATSSLTPYIAAQMVKSEKTRKKLFPISLRPQAHDIINFWLFYTVARSKLHFNKVPFKTVMVSGYVLDPKGEKMSKSKGNVVAPKEMIERYGADALRHWAAKASLGENLRWNEEEVRGSKRTITKIWNATRFSLLHFDSKDKNRKPVLKNLKGEDIWILTRLQEAIKEYKENFEKYEFKKARETIDNFFWKHFCDNYLEIVKPRLYAEKSENEYLSDASKKSARNTLYAVLLSVLKLYAPFIPFLTEELFQGVFKEYEKEKSIHQARLPKVSPNLTNQKTKEGFNSVIAIISEIRKYRSERKISQKEEINKLLIRTNNKEIANYSELLRAVMNIKNISIEDQGQTDEPDDSSLRLIFD